VDQDTVIHMDHRVRHMYNGSEKIGKHLRSGQNAVIPSVGKVGFRQLVCRESRHPEMKIENGRRFIGIDHQRNGVVVTSRILQYTKIRISKEKDNISRCDIQTIVSHLTLKPPFQTIFNGKRTDRSVSPVCDKLRNMDIFIYQCCTGEGFVNRGTYLTGRIGKTGHGAPVRMFRNLDFPAYFFGGIDDFGYCGHNDLL